MKINKYSSLGNDIILVQSSKQDLVANSSTIHKLLMNKNIKYDQWISVKALVDTQNNFGVTIFNQDGSSAENCMNGALCLAKHLEKSSKDLKKEFNIKTVFGQWIIRSLKKDSYSVKMKLPTATLLNQRTLEKNGLDQCNISLSNNTNINLSLINMGNPHAVFFSKDIKSIPLISWGEDLQQSKYFPNGVNLSLAVIKNRKQLHLRIYERGVGETKSCGSAACASVMTGIRNGYLDHKVSVVFKNGTLNISYDQNKNMIEVIGSVDDLGEICTD